MGIYSEIDMEMKMGYGDDPFAEDTRRPLTSPYAAETSHTEPVVPAPASAPSAPSVQTAPTLTAPAPSGAVEPEGTPAAAPEENEDAKRKAHEEAEAKRKEEWEARQARRKAEEEKKLAELAAMSDDEVTMAAMNKVGADAEKLTRRNMKECVTEHTPIPGDIQTVHIEVEEPVAGQPLNFQALSVGEPDAYMAGVYPYEGKVFWFDLTGGGVKQLDPGAVARSDGGTYRMTAFVHPKEGHQFAKATEKTRTFWVNGQKAKGSCNTDGSQAQVDYTFTFPAAKPGAGVAVSGKITSYNPNNATTIQLKQGDTVKYSTTIDADSGSGQKAQDFSFPTVAAGTYDLVVTKSAHLSYTVKNVVVGDGPLDLTTMTGKAYQTITLLCGDIDGNGFINSTDLGIILKGQNYGKSTATAGDKAADLDGNGFINSTDLGIVLQGQHYGKSAVSVSFAG